jgi:hypothetical protein
VDRTAASRSLTSLLHAALNSQYSLFRVCEENLVFINYFEKDLILSNTCFSLQISHNLLFLKYVHNKKSNTKTNFSTFVGQSWALFCRKLRICDLQMNNNKFANLRLPNTPKYLRICDLRTFKTVILISSDGDN